MPKSSSIIQALAAATLTLVSSAAFAAAGALTSGPTSTVVYVGGNDLVLKSADGKLLNYTVPASYKFAANGKDLTLAELKPGTSLSKSVAPGTDPRLVSSVEVVKGKVYSVAPPTGLTLSLTEGVKELTVPSGTTFLVQGKPLTMSDIKPDMMLEATVVTTTADPSTAASSSPSTPPMQGALLVAQTSSSGDLPDSGTDLPLVGLLGLSFLGLGGALLYRPKATTRI